MRDFMHQISLLEALFRNLPESLPLDPLTSHLNFGLDPDFLDSEGWGPAFNRQMEIAWRSWEGPIHIPERGKRLFICIQLLRDAMLKVKNIAEKEMWVGNWLDKLVKAAQDSGAIVRSESTTIMRDIQAKQNPTIDKTFKTSNTLLFWTTTIQKIQSKHRQRRNQHTHCS
jgi:hypothetical protein